MEGKFIKLHGNVQIFLVETLRRGIYIRRSRGKYLKRRRKPW